MGLNPFSSHYSGFSMWSEKLIWSDCFFWDNFIIFLQIYPITLLTSYDPRTKQSHLESSFEILFLEIYIWFKISCWNLKVRMSNRFFLFLFFFCGNENLRETEQTVAENKIKGWDSGERLLAKQNLGWEEQILKAYNFLKKKKLLISLSLIQLWYKK